MQVLGDVSGGIRKHVHDIVKSGVDYDTNIFYVHGSTLDVKAQFDIKSFDLYGINRLQLDIVKKPHWRDLSNIFILLRYCYNNNIDIIHGHGAKGGIYARIVGFLLKIPSIYTPHGGSLHASFGFFEGFIYRFIERIFKRITALFIFESIYSLQRFEVLCGILADNKYIVNYNGVDETLFLPKKHWNHGVENKVNLLVVGILRDMKGQQVAIKALNILNRSNFYQFHLHFCGSGPEFSSLVNFCKDNFIDNVTFHGDVGDVAAYYEKCNIVLVPSLFESFGYVAVEASLMLRPVIGSNCGGLTEVIQDKKTGYLFDLGDAASLSNRIITILNDTDKTNEMVNLAKDFVENNFTLKKMLDNLFDNYKNL
ncbi:glycosyltransferase [Polynucleobacter necessarius]|uniref:glycosyltransferase n=1 Tax=Polynucleobacter necessarius TaxID=576610 RepID=UPI001E424EBF|nr:glycosyltransferase [Polynucleobacter necessarius]